MDDARVSAEADRAPRAAFADLTTRVDPVTAWRRMLAVAGCAIAAIAALFGETAAAMAETWWTSATYNHGVLIVPIAAYLGWIRRHRLAILLPAVAWTALPIVACGALVWLLGYLSVTMFLRQIGMVLAVQGAIITLIGWRAARVLALPLAYLFLAVPFGEGLVPHLQDFTARFSVRFLQLVGIPTFVEGYYISTPSGNFLVAEACAGLRFLISTFALGVMFADLMYHAWWRRALFIGLSIAVPIIANGMRAFAIIYLAYVSNNEIAAGVDHITYGWIFFSLVTAVLMLIGLTFRDHEAAGARTKDASAMRLTGASSMPETAAAAAIASAIVAVFVGYGGLALREPTAATDVVLDFPPPVGASVDPTAPPWIPVFVGADAQLDRLYLHPSGEVSLHIGFYRYERQNAKAITAAHQLAPAPWQIIGTGHRTVAIAGRQLAIPYARLKGQGQARVVWYWYWIGGRFVADPVEAKLRKTSTALLLSDPSTAIIAVSAEYVESPRPAEQRLSEFVASLASLLDSLGQAAVEQKPGNR